jgi:hypothetical protein
MSYSIQAAFLSSLIYDSTRVNNDALQSGVRYVETKGVSFALISS